MRLVQIPTLFDNYTYLIICEKTKVAALVDSPDAEATWKIIEQEHVDPVAILCTHDHGDHVGGNEELLRKKKMRVYGSHLDQRSIPGLTDTVRAGDQISVGSINIHVLEVPGHTRGHLAFVANGSLFCGDTLFVAGCGRLFGGTSAQMVDSLTKLKNLPDTTKVYCAHEYTQKNCEFALTVEPHNQNLLKKYGEVLRRRKNNLSTVPSTIGEEKQYNPFLRWNSPEIIETAKKEKGLFSTDAVSVFAAVRELKNDY